MAIVVNKSKLDNLNEICLDLMVPIRSDRYSAGSILECFRQDNDFIWMPFSYGLKHAEIVEREKYKRKFRYIGNPREHQIDDFKNLVEMLQKYRSATIAAYTGYGKTHVGSYVAAALGYKTIVVVPYKALIKQWTNVFEGDIRKCKIAIVGESSNEDLDDADVIITYVKRIKLITDEVLKDIKFMILDETQSLATDLNLDQIMSISPYYILGESATPSRADGSYKMMELVLGKKIIKPIEEKKWRCIFSRVNIRIPEQRGPNGINFPQLITDMSMDETCISKVVKTVEMNQSHKFMILVSRKKLCTILCDKFTELGISCDYKHGEKKEYTESKVFVAVDKSCGVGFDEKNGCTDFTTPSNVIIIINSIKDTNLFSQMAGRGKRSDTPIIISFHSLNSVTINHANTQADALTHANNERIQAGHEAICSVEIDSEENDYVDLDLPKESRTYYEREERAKSSRTTRSKNFKGTRTRPRRNDYPEEDYL